MNGGILHWTVATAAILFTLPAVAQSASVNWAGPYAGLQAGLASSSFSATGYAAADSLIAGPLTATQSFGGGGALAGVYGGFNFQSAQDFVLGGEADFNLTQLSATSGQILDLHAGSGGCNNTTSSYICLGPVNSSVKWYGTVRGTLGQAIGRLLLYGAGGLAYGEVESSVGGTWKFATQVPSSSFFDMRTSAIQFGWTAGLGMAFAVSNNLSVRLEWSHVDLGGRTIGAGSGSVPSPSVNYAASVTEQVAFDTLRLGLTVRLP